MVNKIAELLLRKQKLLELRQGEPGPNELVDISALGGNHAHPTRSEAFQEAALGVLGHAVHI
jgi:hypothetical protein